MLELKPKIAIEISDEKNQLRKKILTGKYRKGLKLFALDTSKMEVYEVKIEDEVVFEFGSKEKQSKYNATINDKHWHIWSLNKKNAERKFLKQLNTIN